VSVVDDFKTLLAADTGVGGVYTLLTGGIYTYEDTGRLGPNQDSTPDAFTAVGMIKPCLVIKGRAQTPDGGIWDDDTQAVSTRQVIELWFYDDGDTGWSVIAAANSRAFVVLHGNTVGTQKRIPRYAGTPIRDARDANLDYACILRTDYDVRALMS